MLKRLKEGKKGGKDTSAAETTLAIRALSAFSASIRLAVSS